MQSFSGLIIDIIVFIKMFFSDLGLQAITNIFLFHIILVILITIIFSLIINKIIIVFIRKWLNKLKFDIGKHLISKKVFVPIGWAIPILIFEAGLGDYSPKDGVLSRISEALIILVCVLSITRFLSALSEIFKGNKVFSKTPIQSYMQLVKLIVYVFGSIIIVCVISNTSPITIVSGLGALTAILLLVFKDTILGLVASIQIFGLIQLERGIGQQFHH